MTDSWTSRLGATAFAVAPDAGAPSYGTVFDISNGQWQTSKQFQDFVQDVVAQTKANAIAEQNSVGSLHDAELRRAQQIENGGFDAEKGASWFHKILSVPKAAYNEATRMVNDVGGIDSPEEQWKLYSKSGGLLTKDEFFAFSPETQGYLAAKAHGIKDLHGALSAPGVEPLVQAVGGVYRATTAGAIMAAPFGMAFTTPFAAHPRYRNWFSQDQWAKAWREAGDESFGQALTNGALEPWVQQDTLDEWAKHNSLYQMTSFGVDLAASWYADPLVIGGRAVGATARLARHELPLSERSSITLAARQKLAGQDVTVKNPLTRTLGVQRANSMIDARPGVEELARNTQLSQFTGHAPIPGFRPISASGRVNVFGNRTINREAAATALWHAVRISDETGDRSVLDLTWDAMHGNPNAWAEIQKRKNLAIQDLRDVDKSAQWETIHDAIEGTKTHAKNLEDYISALQDHPQHPAFATDNGTEPLGPDFTDWYNQRLLQVKEEDLAAARDKLRRYDGYDAWYNNLIRENVLTGDPQGITNLAQVGVPRSAIYGAQLHDGARVSTSKARRFLDNHYGVMHSVYHMPKAAFRGWKATTVDNTDLASGPRSFDRQLANLKNLFGYEAPDAMEAFSRAWAAAPDEASRIKVAADFEQNHVMGAVHQFYNLGREADQQVSYDTIMNVYKTVIRKQNEMHEDLNRRLIEGGQYAPADTAGVQQMAGSGDVTSPIRVISHDKTKKQVEVELVDAGHVERYIVDEDKWVKKPLYDGSQPLFETQAPRYFHPIDAWRFHAELQQNPRLLKEIDAGLSRQVLSSGEASMDKLLQGFYQLWKPLTLWRLGWPLRVLMDENARALTILGPIAFMKNYGSAYYQSVVANSVVKGIDYAIYLKNWMKGASKIGPGPIREDMRRGSRYTSDYRVKEYGQPIDRPVPDVPQEFLPQAQGHFLQNLNDDADGFLSYERANYRVAALTEQKADLLDTMTVPVHDDGSPMSLEEVKALPGKLEAIKRELASAEEDLRYRYQDPDFAARNARRAWATRLVDATKDQGPGNIGKMRHEGPSVYNAAIRAPLNDAIVVPLPHTEVDFGAIPIGGKEHDGLLARWQKKHAGLLADGRYVIFNSADGRMMVARSFTRQERKKAEEFLRYIHRDYNGTRMYELRQGERAKTFYYQDKADHSPVYEDLHRVFKPYQHVDTETVRQEHPSPVDTVLDTGEILDQPTVFHGSSNLTAENTDVVGETGRMLPVDEVDNLNGRLYLDGLYGAQNEATSLGYAGDYGYSQEHMFTIRHRETGKKLKVWDLDREITQEQWDSLKSYMQANKDRFGLNDSDLSSMGLDFNEPAYHSWKGVVTEISYSPNARKAMRHYLQEEHGAGALTVYGQTDGQVFVFFQPEDLQIMPLYTEKEIGRRWMSMEEFFDHPTTNFKVPESQIVRGWDPTAERGLQLGASRDELAQLDSALDDEHHWLYRKLRQRREYGKGVMTIKGSDGTTKEVPDAYAGLQGELSHQLVGSAPVIDYVSGGHGSVTSYLHGRQLRYKTVSAPEVTAQTFRRGTDENKAYVEYFGKWADMVNEHLGPSKVVQQIVAGKRDHEIADWLTKTEQGRRVARQILNNEFDDPMLYVMRVRDLVDRYVPNRELQRQMVKRSLKPSELRKGVANEDLPDLLAPEVEDVTNGIFSFRRTIGTLFDKMWNLLGTKPIDAFSRHPFYRGMYDLKLKNLAKVYKGRDLDENMIEALTNQAHTFALEQTQRYLWSLLDNTNFAEATRFIFPFWRAQREAMAKWAQIVFERPETVGRFMALNRIAYQHLTVLNQDGEEVGLRGKGLYGSNYHPTDRVVLQIPKALDKLPYFGQALRELGSTRIPIGSINTVLQGESPVLPGYGPTITIPVDKFLRWQSDTLGIPEDDNSTLGFLHKWLFPVGRPAAGGSGAAAVNPLTGPFWEGIISQLVPGWARRVQQTAPSMAAFNNYMTIRRQMEQDLIDQGRDPKELKDADVQKVSHSFNALRIFTSLFAPVQVEYAARDQMFLDEYHKFQKQYGIDAQEKFLEKYGPQYARFVTSSSTSDYGVPPTTAGLRDALKVRDLLAKYGSKDDGGWGSLMISPESFDDYNQNAYSAEFQIPVSPASANKLRRSLSPEERARQAEEMSGWFEYRKINAMIQAEMSRRGLTSLNQSDASDLRELKRRIVEGYDGQPGLQQKYPAWAVAYEQGTQDIYSRVESLKGWVWDKRFDNRPDIKGVRQYLLIRKQVTDLLDQNYANGGSRNLNTEENRNTGLYDYFYNRVGQLVLDNPAFGEVYTRYLEGDTLEQGSKGYK